MALPPILFAKLQLGALGSSQYQHTLVRIGLANVPAYVRAIFEGYVVVLAVVVVLEILFLQLVVERKDFVVESLLFSC